MATLAELARNTRLDGPQLAHLERLTAGWGFLADLCFADLLLYVPTAAPQAVDPESGRDDEQFLVLGQMRPTTSQTLYREDQIGRVVTSAECPLVARAWALGEFIDGEIDFSPRGEAANVQCIPVRLKEELIGVLTRESAPSIGRRTGELERVYLEIFDRLARMISAGEFPFDADVIEQKEAPRIGDGVARLDGSARVDYASPNFVSALHRMGIHGNVLGARLGELGFEESPVRAAFAIGLPVTEEVERNDVTVLARCIPLLERGQMTGALVIMRDVSDLRRRDRLLISKDVTIREMHHRVKNNLQTISSILSLQGRRLASPEAKEAIEESVRRVRAIALVHETLSTGPSAEVDFTEIVQSLVRGVEEGLVAPDRKVRLLVKGDAGLLRAEVATPLAVVLTELLHNAVEHGYPDDVASGEVVVSMANDGVELVVRVRDDGRGLPQGFSLDAPTTPSPDGGPSLGLTIVRTLVRHELKGQMSMTTDGGTLVEIKVPVTAVRES
jgi:two-component sensor histidine kinase